jgi:hypothetical protein
LPASVLVLVGGVLSGGWRRKRRWRELLSGHDAFESESLGYGTVFIHKLVFFISFTLFSFLRVVIIKRERE